jgi:hypothetical protein
MCNYNIFRTLNADEIDVRVQQVVKSNDKYRALLLLYKNARVDMDMLDEKFGCLNWQREHIFKDGKNYCRVSVYDDKKQMWVSKEDVGVESNTEETKGEASDAFKRACVNLGIGRELYTTPQVVVELSDKEAVTKNRNGKDVHVAASWLKFRVSAITYNAERQIIGLAIADNKGVTRYHMGKVKSEAPVNAAPTREKKTITEDMILDANLLTKLCEWLNDRYIKRKNTASTVKDIIHYYYDCPEDVADNIISEYNRQYPS